MSESSYIVKFFFFQTKAPPYLINQRTSNRRTQHRLLKRQHHSLIPILGRMENILPILIPGLKPAVAITDPMPLKHLINIHKHYPSLLRRLPQHPIQRPHNGINLERDAIKRRRRQDMIFRTMFMAFIRGVKPRIAKDIDLSFLSQLQIRGPRLLEQGRQAVAQAVERDVVVVPRDLARVRVIGTVPGVVEQREHALLDRGAEHAARVAAHADAHQVRVPEVVADARQLLVRDDGSVGADLRARPRGVGPRAGREAEAADAGGVAEGGEELVGVGFRGAAAGGRGVAVEAVEGADAGGVRVAEGGVVREDLVGGVPVDAVVVARLEGW